jgi:hypothetical protein
VGVEVGEATVEVGGCVVVDGEVPQAVIRPSAKDAITSKEIRIDNLFIEFSPP